MIDSFRKNTQSYLCRYWDSMHKTMYYMDTLLTPSQFSEEVVFAGVFIDSYSSNDTKIYDGDILLINDMIFVVYNDSWGHVLILIGRYDRKNVTGSNYEIVIFSEDYILKNISEPSRIPGAYEFDIYILTNIFEINKLEDIKNINIQGIIANSSKKIKS